MSKKTTKLSKTKYLVRRYNTYFAELTVPEDVRHLIKKAKFSQTTGTGDRDAAQAITNLIVLKWKSEIAQARQESDDPIINSALELNKLLKSTANKGNVLDIIDDEEWKLRHDQGHNHLADAFKKIATGKQKHLKTVLPDWKSHQKLKGLADKTIDQMESDIELLLNTFPTANLMNNKNVENWIEYLGIYGKLTPSSINRIVGSGRNFFKFLKSIKEVDKTEIDPFIVPETYRISNKPNSKSANRVKPWLPFEEDDLVNLHKEALNRNDIPLANLIVIGAYTGGRIEEICSIKCSDINLEKRYLNIVDSKTEAGKRQIPIHSNIIKLIDSMISSTTNNYLFCDLTENKYGDRSNGIGKRFGRLKKDFGFDRQHVFHSIRKTLVTKLENAGVSENLAADIVGHEKPRITYGLYSGGASLEVKKEALQKISYQFIS